MVLGGVELVDLIGIGGAGSVYRGVRKADGNEVAIKVFEPSHFRASTLRTRIIRELHALAQLEHPHIIEIYGFREDEKTELAYFAMEFVDGRDLYRTIDQDGPISEKRALRILRAMLDALDAIHQAGFVHRDLKPDNILIAHDGTPKLTDFGLVRHIGDTGLTTEGAVLGTPLYMAPEQFVGGNVDHRADFYGLGCVIYHAVTGHTPFDGDFQALTHKHQNTPPVPPSQLAGGLTPEFEQFVLRLMAKQPELRFPDALSALHAMPGPKDRLAARSSLRAAKRERGKTRRLETTTKRSNTSRRRRGFVGSLPGSVRLAFAGLSVAVLLLAATVIALLLGVFESTPESQDRTATAPANGNEAGNDDGGADLRNNNNGPANRLPELPEGILREAEFRRLLERIEQVLHEPADAGLAARETLVALRAWPPTEAEANLMRWQEAEPADSPLAAFDTLEQLEARLAEVGMRGWLERRKQEFATLAGTGRVVELERRLAEAAHEIPSELRDEAFEPWGAFLDEAGRWREALLLAHTLTHQARTLSSRHHARHFAQQVRAADEELDLPRAARMHIFAPVYREVATVTHEGEAARVRSRTLSGPLPGYEHLIEHDVVVEHGERLDIGPGAVLRFAPEARLIVRGELFAHGSESEPIRCEPSREGNTWPGIRVEGGRAHFRSTHFVAGRGSVHDLAGPRQQRQQQRIRAGGMLAAWEAELKLVDCRLSEGRLESSHGDDDNAEEANVIVAGGGALYASRSEVTLVRTTFANNVSPSRGGAVALDRCRRVEIRGCRFVENRAATLGGGLWMGRCHGSVEECEFTGNRAEDAGGAIAFVEVSSETRLAHTRFENNHATQGGGAVALRRCAPQLTGNDFVDNTTDNNSSEADATTHQQPLPHLLLELPTGMDRAQRVTYLRRLETSNRFDTQ